MYIVDSYFLAVILSIVMMICWGSWANTQKLASKSWPFTLFYWDYALGFLLFVFLICITLGSFGSEGRSFFQDIHQASFYSIMMAVLGGTVNNMSNIMLVSAIDIAGMAVAFPVGVGIAMILGVVLNYISVPIGNPVILFLGVFLVVVAIVLDAVSYKIKDAMNAQTVSSDSRKGIIIAIISGFLMGTYYYFVAQSISLNFTAPEPGKLTPYTATFMFSVGLFLSSFVFNTFAMKTPFKGRKVNFGEYFQGSFKIHMVGILGGVICSLGGILSFITSEKAGYAISYGLGQGATLVAALWGVFIWKEFKGAPAKVNLMLALMFIFFLIGLILIIVSRLV